MKTYEIMKVLLAKEAGLDLEQRMLEGGDVCWIPAAKRVYFDNKFDFTLFEYRVRPGQEDQGRRDP